MNTLGENIRILRKSNGKESQSKLAEKIHVTQQTISMYEKGERTLKLEKLREIADYYNISIKDLVESDLKIDLNENDATIFKEFYSIL